MIEVESRRLRVLLVAEACNPEWTSVPLLAYYWYRALRKHVDVTLVTQIRNKPAFDRCTDAGKVVFIDSEPIAAPLHRLGKIVTFGHPNALGTRNVLSWPAYLYFERLVWKRFRSQLHHGDFDLVHRLTPLSPTFPSPIAGRCPVPFVIGPLNGSLPWPPGTQHIRSNEGEWLAPLRSVCSVLPYWRKTFEKAALIIAAGSHVKRDLPYRARRRSVVLAENGVDIDRFSANGAPPISQRRPFTVLFVGRLIPLKQPALILEAVARIQLKKYEIRVVYVGEGPERTRIIRTAKKLGLDESVQLLGNVPHHELPHHYRSASLLALPSVHESGGAVLLEAMASGLPCVVVDYGGPGEYISSDAGIKVPLVSYDGMVYGFANAFTRLFHNSCLQEDFSTAARRQAETVYAWDAKAKTLIALYYNLIENRDS